MSKKKKGKFLSDNQYLTLTKKSQNEFLGKSQIEYSNKSKSQLSKQSHSDIFGKSQIVFERQLEDIRFSTLEAIDNDSQDSDIILPLILLDDKELKDQETFRNDNNLKDLNTSSFQIFDEEMKKKEWFVLKNKESLNLASDYINEYNKNEIYNGVLYLFQITKKTNLF